MSESPSNTQTLPLAIAGAAGRMGHMLIEAVRAALPALDVLAVKGSRFMRMERLMDTLQEGASC